MANAKRTLSFELARLEDIPALVKNETRSYAFPWTEGVFRDCITGPQDCWVALCPGGSEGDGQGQGQGAGVGVPREIIGHTVLSLAAGEGHLLNLCITRDRQGYGYGRQFMNFVVQTVASAGAEVLFLEVRPSNRVALSLYQSMGFRDIGVRKDYYPAPLGREDARVLALQFPGPSDPPSIRTNFGRDHFGAV